MKNLKFPGGRALSTLKRGFISPSRPKGYSEAYKLVSKEQPYSGLDKCNLLNLVPLRDSLIVLDIDTKNAPEAKKESLNKSVREFFSSYGGNYIIAKTGSNGLHVYLRITSGEGLNKSIGAFRTVETNKTVLDILTASPKDNVSFCNLWEEGLSFKLWEFLNSEEVKPLEELKEGLSSPEAIEELLQELKEVYSKAGIDLISEEEVIKTFKIRTSPNLRTSSDDDLISEYNSGIGREEAFRFLVNNLEYTPVRTKGEEVHLLRGGNPTSKKSGIFHSETGVYYQFTGSCSYLTEAEKGYSPSYIAYIALNKDGNRWIEHIKRSLGKWEENPSPKLKKTPTPPPTLEPTEEGINLELLPSSFSYFASICDGVKWKDYSTILNIIASIGYSLPSSVQYRSGFDGSGTYDNSNPRALSFLHFGIGSQGNGKSEAIKQLERLLKATSDYYTKIDREEGGAIYIALKEELTKLEEEVNSLKKSKSKDKTKLSEARKALEEFKLREEVKNWLFRFHTGAIGRSSQPSGGELPYVALKRNIFSSSLLKRPFKYIETEAKNFISNTKGLQEQGLSALLASAFSEPLSTESFNTREGDSNNYPVKDNSYNTLFSITGVPSDLSVIDTKSGIFRRFFLYSIGGELPPQRPEDELKREDKIRNNTKKEENAYKFASKVLLRIAKDAKEAGKEVITPTFKRGFEAYKEAYKQAKDILNEIREENNLLYVLIWSTAPHRFGQIVLLLHLLRTASDLEEEKNSLNLFKAYRERAYNPKDTTLALQVFKRYLKEMEEALSLVEHAPEASGSKKVTNKWALLLDSIPTTKTPKSKLYNKAKTGILQAIAKKQGLADSYNTFSRKFEPLLTKAIESGYVEETKQGSKKLYSLSPSVN